MLTWYAYVQNDPVNLRDMRGLFSEKLLKAINAHLNETYASGVNDCDIWAENTILEANPDSDIKTVAGAAESTNAIDHHDNLSGLTKTELIQTGDYYAIQSRYKGTELTPVHVLLVGKNEDGSVDVAHMTNNPEGGKPTKDTPGYSEILHYGTVEAFMNDGWGSLEFYYLGSQTAEDKKNK